MTDENKPAVNSLDIPVAALAACKWNTHHAGLKDKAFLGLVESIKANGLIQRVACRTTPGGGLEIIDGHRRVEAAREAGLETVPCDVYYGLSDADAMKMTATANIQRLDNDPLLEAELIERMERDGMTRREIAAALGKDETYVARRARLTSLTKLWRDVVRLADEKPSVAFLEDVARHEPEMQDEVARSAFEYQIDFDDDDEEEDADSGDAEDMEDMEDEEDGDADTEDEEDDEEPFIINEAEVRRMFRSRMRALDPDKVPFTLAKCAKCPHNTACSALLFPELEEGGKDDHCMDADCFTKRWNEAVDAEIERLAKQGVKVVEVKYKWDIPNSYNAKFTKTEEGQVPYSFVDDGVRWILWSKKPEKPQRTVKTEEERAAEREKKRTAKLLRSARDKVRALCLANDNGFSDLYGGKYEQVDAFTRVAERYLASQLKCRWKADELIDLIAEEYGFTASGDDRVLTSEEREEYRKLFNARAKAAQEAAE